MSAKDLIDLSDRQLILQILAGLKKTSSKIRLHQNLSREQKSNIARIDQLRLDKNLIILRPYSGGQFQLNPSSKIYIHSNYRTTLFKTKVQLLNKLNLEIQMPEFIKIVEGRAQERVNLCQNQKFSALVKYEGVGKKINVRVLDLSDAGVGLGVPELFYNVCQVGSFIYLTSTQLNQLYERVAIVRNKSSGLSKLDNKEAHVFRLGLEIFEETDLEELL